MGVAFTPCPLNSSLNRVEELQCWVEKAANAVQNQIQMMQSRILLFPTARIARFFFSKFDLLKPLFVC